MSCPENDPVQPGSTIADALVRIGPRTIEGDQGRVTMPSVDDAIKALEYDRKRSAMKNRAGIRGVLRTITGFRLSAHDGRAS